MEKSEIQHYENRIRKLAKYFDLRDEIESYKKIEENEGAEALYKKINKKDLVVKVVELMKLDIEVNLLSEKIK